MKVPFPPTNKVLGNRPLRALNPTFAKAELLLVDGRYPGLPYPRLKVRFWDSVVGDEVGATIISGWRKPSPMNHPIFVGRGEIHTSHEKGGYSRNGSIAVVGQATPSGGL